MTELIAAVNLLRNFMYESLDVKVEYCVLMLMYTHCL